MRDFVSCFSEHAIQVSDTSCFTDHAIKVSDTSCFTEHAIKVSDTSCSGSSTQSPSVHKTICSLYRSTLSTQKHLLITVTWCKNLMGNNFSITVATNDHPPALAHKTIDPNSQPIWKKKGTRSFESDDTKIDIFWDLSSARYEMGPEPINGFYVAVTADSELGLLLGDTDPEQATKKFIFNTQIAHFTMVARKDYVFGKCYYETKARFFDCGPDHDISIKCRGENGLLKDPELFVAIDQKKVVHVKRLQWKFRGNQTIFIDGSPVDMMWDVHGWFINPLSGIAVFMFRKRSGLESRLWLEEKLQLKEESVGFSLLIYACRSP
ncbi:uncharacterized protein LOC131235357 [Magnolia sinica]|uniref:uncharacterized protein LOC131235357 n=1 Tax=Magnolia sinica TaxID=86752 RepID=UPI0026599B2C|nr:uncharacterized protein LOC131235357 [Magnolia sinica]